MLYERKGALSWLCQLIGEREESFHREKPPFALCLREGEIEIEGVYTQEICVARFIKLQTDLLNA